jgi:hypothetical protein
MTFKQRKLLAAGGYALLCAVFVVMIVDHTTSDMSKYDRELVVGKWARLQKLLYQTFGRKGILALDAGFLVVGILAVGGSLRRAFKEKEPRVDLDPAIRQRAENSASRMVCACCEKPVPGGAKDLPEEAMPVEPAKGYFCLSCGALVCAECADARVHFSRWDGWKRSPCPVCGKRFAPDTAVVE